MKFKGKAWVFGDHINTDLIIPARYLNTSNYEELAKHCMEDADPNFTKKIKKGDIIVAGKNFGCGSSREHAPIAIKYCGISCVVAESFARIFFRNAINTGLPIFECKEAREIKQNDELEIDANKGIIKNISTNKTYIVKPLPDFIQQIVKSGGLMEYVKSKLERNV